MAMGLSGGLPVGFPLDWCGAGPSRVRADAGGAIELVAYRETKAGQDVFAVEIVSFGQHHDSLRGVIHSGSPVGRINVPDEFNSGREVVSQLACRIRPSKLMWLTHMWHLDSTGDTTRPSSRWRSVFRRLRRLPQLCGGLREDRLR